MRYTKMHGAGNSFILLENLHGELQGEDFHSLALRLCDKKTGPGADGLIVVVPARDADYGMLFYNADGSLGEMCGNGARCIARYGVEHGLARDAEHVRVLATAGLVTARRVSEEQYEIRLNDPSVAEPARIACVNGEEIPCAYVELGDPGIPHAVLELDESAFDDLDALRERGRALRHAAVFPRGANISFIALLSPTRLRAITFERGVEDFTLACGTGAGAIAVARCLAGKLPGGTLEIEMPGGRLSVRLRREGGRICDVFLTGPTAVVETGEFSVT